MRTISHLSFFSALFFLMFAVNFSAIAKEVKMPQMHIAFTGEVNYEEYIPGTMQLIEADGMVVELPAVFKTRGTTALRYPMKPSLNMKLQDYDGNEIDFNLLGIREASSFILDAMAIDRICMRNRVCFDIWNDFYRLPYSTDFDGRNGTKGKFVEMYINGQYKGIYCLSDKINRKLLNLKKTQTDDSTGEVTFRGVLYKQGTNDIENQDIPGLYNGGMDYVVEWHNAWELHEPDDYPCEEVWAPLLDFYDGSHRDNYDYIKNHFYTDNLSDFTLHLMVLCISDNWGNKNKYFSIQNIQSSGDAARFVVTPWDLDTSLGGEWDGSFFDGVYNQWTPEEIVNSAREPFAGCLRQEDFNKMLRKRWIESRYNVFSVESVTQRLRDYGNYFIESGAWKRQTDYWDDYWEKHGEGPLYVSDLDKEIELISQWYARRFDTIDKFFNLTEEEKTGIDFIETSSEKDPTVFNLMGISISGQPSVPGVYIINGKKICVR